MQLSPAGLKRYLYHTDVDTTAQRASIFNYAKVVNNQNTLAEFRLHLPPQLASPLRNCFLFAPSFTRFQLSGSCFSCLFIYLKFIYSMHAEISSGGPSLGRSYRDAVERSS